MFGSHSPILLVQGFLTRARDTTWAAALVLAVGGAVAGCDAGSATSSDKCGDGPACDSGSLCVDAVCRTVCNYDRECPPAEACTEGVCGAGDGDCAATSECPASTVCRSSECVGGACVLTPTPDTGIACPLSDEDANSDNIEDDGENWTGLCGADGSCAACVDDSSCGSELCECTDDSCSTRVCMSVDCGICGYSSDSTTCIETLGTQVPTKNPGQCDEEFSCFAGACMVDLGGHCTTDAQCGSGHCECGNATCDPDRMVCASVACDCQYTTDGTSCTAPVAGGTGCDDGLFCNGTDTCHSGVCEHSGDPCPGPDGDSNCAESCSEVDDTCAGADPDDSSCDDGLFCTAVDTCQSGVCEGAGDPCSGPDGDDNCSESCSETAGDCTGPDPNDSSCDDGLFCTAVDTCQSGACEGAGDPCSGPDGDNDCSESCNENAGDCTGPDPNDSNCDDGLFCTAVDTCQTGVCQGAGDPCPGPNGDADCSESCDDDADNCEGQDPDDSGCDDGLFCTALDTCQSGVCEGTGDPCPGPDGDSDCRETCSEVDDTCSGADTDGSRCDDGFYCTGDDTCSGGVCNQHTGSPCPGPDGDGDCSESCDDVADTCTGPDEDGTTCDNGIFCDGDGDETCGGGVCRDGTGSPPCPGADGDADCSETCNESTDTCTGNDPIGSDCGGGFVCDLAGGCAAPAGTPCTGPDDCGAGTCYDFTGTHVCLVEGLRITAQCRDFVDFLAHARLSGGQLHTTAQIDDYECQCSSSTLGLTANCSTTDCGPALSVTATTSASGVTVDGDCTSTQGWQ